MDHYYRNNQQKEADVTVKTTATLTEVAEQTDIFHHRKSETGAERRRASSLCLGVKAADFFSLFLSFSTKQNPLQTQ